MTLDQGAIREHLVAYVHGDAGLEGAIRQIIDEVPAGARRVVHLGCGIGWLASEVRRSRPACSVLAMDDRRPLIDAGVLLFGQEGVRFEAVDVASLSADDVRDADVLIVTLPDNGLAEDSWAALTNLLSGSGPSPTVVVHTPASAGMSDRVPDESRDPSSREADQSGERIAALALAIDGRIRALTPVGPGSGGHRVAVVVRGDEPTGRTLEAGSPARLEDRRRRAGRVRARLEIRVTHDGYLISDRPGPTVVIVCPNRNAPSETFVRAQIERLPTKVEVLFGTYPDLEREDGRPLMPGWVGLARHVAGWFGPRWQARLESRWLALYLRRRKAKVMLAVYGPTGAALFPICRRIKLPLVTEFLGYDASHRTILRTNKKPYLALLQQEAATIAVSDDIERRLYELGARQGSVHTIACGVDSRQFQGAEPALNPPVFLAAGRFVEKKGPHLTLLAFSRLLADVPDARLVMVGGGPLLASSYQLADALGIREAVEFAGYLSHEALATRMRGARAFVQHSIIAPSGDSEGMPVAILEAGASGLPVVATRHGGIPDAVIEGETGLLVDEGDVDAMADRMRRLALDPELASRLGAQARAHIAREFELSDTVGRLWDVLQLAMASDARRTGG